MICIESYRISPGAIVLANVAGFAQEATVRIHWSTPLAAEIPWYVTSPVSPEAVEA